MSTTTSRAAADASVLSALAASRAPVFAFAAVGLTWGCFAAMAPVLKARVGVNDADWGLLLLATALGLSTTLFLAQRVDRWLGAWAMPTGTLALAAAAAFGPGQAGSAVAVFAALTVLGATSGVTDVVMNARVSEIETRTARSLMNVNHAMFSVAYAVSALLTGAMREAAWSPEAIFATVAVLVAATAPFQMMRVDAPPEDDGADASRLPFALVATCGLVVMIAFMAEATVESWSALHIERTLGGGAAEGAFGPAMLGLTMAAGRFSGQAVAARMTETAVIAWATGLAVAGVLVAAAAPTPTVAYLGFGLMGLGISVIGPMGLALAGRLAPAAVRTGVIARVAVIGFLGFFLAPALMGLGAEAFGLRWAFAGVAAVLAVEWALIRRARRRD